VSPTPTERDPAEVRRGTAYGIAAYGIWGIFPLYFHSLKPSGAWEILAHRIVWTLAVCVLILMIRRDWGWLRTVLASRRLTAVLTGRTYEAALGYFLHPIVTVFLGVFVLGERLRRLQWAAVAVGGIASVYLSIAGGVLPWISLSLALTFGLYGLTKNRVGVSLKAMHSLAAETMVLAPVALVILLVLAQRGETTFAGHGGVHTGLLVASGVVTAIPLLLFAAAARRIPLVTVGLIQFMTPVLQLLCGVFLLNEHVSGRLWVGFGIVWIALALLTFDSLRNNRNNRARTDLIDPEH
jgi:chloramphenicol-sensitive protein RarD